MNKKVVSINIVVLSIFLVSIFALSCFVTVMVEQQPVIRNNTVIIDAGHGGVDGGAISVSGFKESDINLQISIRLQDMCNLLGIKTVMIRTDDSSVHTEGESISQKKISDLKNRVKIVNNFPEAVLVSIHQNYFSDGKYRGAQVFYADTAGSELLAEGMQRDLVNNLYPGSNRMIKKTSGIYLMDHIQCPGILIECGFLSNLQDESLLTSPYYQKALCTVIAANLQSYINSNGIS